MEGVITNDWCIIRGSLGSENLFLWTGDMSNGKGKDHGDLF